MRLLMWALIVAGATSAHAQVFDQPFPNGLPQVFVELEYPSAALAEGVTGRVVATVTTDGDGRITAAEVISGPPLLAAPVLANLKTWTLAAGLRKEAIVYRFEVDRGVCNEDRSFFKMALPNLAVITACRGRGRTMTAAPWASTFQFATFGDPPPYPRIPFHARLGGLVVLDVAIDATGKVVDAQSL